MSEFSHHELSIQLEETSEELRARWRGSSGEMDVGERLSPFLNEFLERARRLEKPMVLDFTDMELMNSYTFIPLVQMLDRVREDGDLSVVILYDPKRQWQKTSFSAMITFKSDRIVFQEN